jgi:hypothetical protein
MTGCLAIPRAPTRTRTRRASGRLEDVSERFPNLCSGRVGPDGPSAASIDLWRREASGALEDISTAEGRAAVRSV